MVQYMRKSSKWKYAKEKKTTSYDTYLRFKNDEPKKVKFKFWKFERNPVNDSLFTCTVVEEDGEKVDKIWSVWNVELRDKLKKSLAGLNANKREIEIELVRKEEDMEESFEVIKLEKLKISE